MSGKGDTPRPYSVKADEFASNWDRIFGAKPSDGRDAAGEQAAQEQDEPK